MNNIKIVAFFILIISGCNFVNKETSQISLLNTTCFSEKQWIDLKRKHSIDSIKDSILLTKIKDIQNQTFKTDILYFKDYPEELVGVEYSCIRYVYNPLISNQILDGFSHNLSFNEKKRILKRVQSLIIEYQCEKGKIESIRFIKEFK